MSEGRTLRRSSRLRTGASKRRTGETAPTNTEERVEEPNNISVATSTSIVEENQPVEGRISTDSAVVNPTPEGGGGYKLLRHRVNPSSANSPACYTRPSNIRTPFNPYHEQPNLEESSPSGSSSSEEEKMGVQPVPTLIRNEAKGRTREVRYKDKPILSNLDPPAVSKFIAEYDIYEAAVVRRRFGLSVAYLSLCLTNEVKVDLVEEGFDMTVQAKTLKYLRKINRNEDRSRSKIVIIEVENIQWKNLGSPSASMGAFLKATDKILRGIHFDNKSIEKEACLKFIKRLPTDFGSSWAKGRLTEEGWNTYKQLKRGLRRAAIPISTWDIQSPARQHQKISKTKRSSPDHIQQSVVKKSVSSASYPKNSDLRIITLANGRQKHIVPRGWPLEKREERVPEKATFVAIAFLPATMHRIYQNNQLNKQQPRASEKRQVNEVSEESPKVAPQAGGQGGVVVVPGDDESPTVKSLDPVDIPEMNMIEMEEWEVAEVISDGSGEEVGPREEGEVLGYAEHAHYRDELSDEILRREYEVEAASSKPHIDTPKMQQFLSNKIEKKVQDLVEAKALSLEQVAEIEINPTSSTFASKPCPVKKLVLEELKKKIQELTDMGMIYQEPNPFFSSPVIMLPKPRKPTEYMMVVDLRKGNKILEKGHWRCDSSYFAKITKLPRTQTLGQLQDVVYVSTWLSDSLPNLSKNKGYLNTRMREIEENIISEKGKNMGKDARKKVDSETWWREEDQVEFQKFLQIIEGCQEKKLKIFEADGQMGIFTDASDKYWSSVLASFSGDGWEPILFVSGEFTQLSRFWSITDKEIYPIIHTLRRYRFLLINVARKIKIFTDHMNVKHLMSSPRDLKQSSFDRIQRWILTVQEFDVEVYHIGGQYNALADLLTRWGYLGSTAGSETKIIPIMDDYNWNLTWKRITFLAREKDIELEKKRLANIRKEQDQSFVGLIENKQEKWRFDPESVSFIEARVGRNFPKNKIKWKDLSVKELLSLQRKILVLAHQISKHGSVEEVVRIMSKYKFQGSNKSDVRILDSKLKRLCLHCDKDLKLERRIYKEIPYAIDSSELLLHSDFMKVYSGYLLVIVEDISRKVLMIYDSSPSAHVTVKGLVRWRAEHGMPVRFKLSTDNGSHFCNQIVSEFNSIYGGQHHFSVVHSPWSNGSIEVMNRYVLRYLRQLCSEYNLDRDRWYELVDLVTDVISNTPTRKGFTPNELTSIFGRKNEMVVEPARELKPFPLINSLNKTVFPKDRARFINLCHKLLSEIEKRRTEIFPIIVEDRRRKREYVNRKFKSSQVQFAPGDFVLMSNIGTQRAQGKLHLRWLGPYVVTDILGTTTYRVKSIDGKNYVAHAQRLGLYEAQPTDFRISDQAKAVFYYNQGVYEVHNLLDIRGSVGGFEALVW
eukprot:augustus_masked-scaffold_26-processed-gene-4.6-mRNA-1 protein AED:1.00 eAED:1.00 QI:0/0/0/0/1/1/6/0/1397